MFVDYARAAMVAYDNTYRVVTGTGRLHRLTSTTPPTSAQDTRGQVPVPRQRDEVNGSGGGTVSAGDGFSATPSRDNNQGWMGLKWTLSPVPVTIDILTVGVHDDFAGAAGTYNVRAANIINWLYNRIGLIRRITDILLDPGWLNAGDGGRRPTTSTT